MGSHLPTSAAGIAPASAAAAALASGLSLAVLLALHAPVLKPGRDQTMPELAF